MASTIFNELKNSGQAFLYVFISPNANLNATIMQKRVEQLSRLKEMYLKDKTYTPDQMIQIIRQGIYEKYGKSPELILQIIFDNAVVIDHKIGDVPIDSGVLTFDSDSNQYYDGSGNAFVLNSKGSIVSKNGQSADLQIETPASLDNLNVASPGTKTTFWDDVKSVIDWIVGLLAKLGVTTGNRISTYSPCTTDWSQLNTTSSLSSAGIGDYIPYVIGGSILYYLISQSKSKKKSKKII